MGFNRDVIHRRRDDLDALGVKVRWAGRRPRLWASVIRELQLAEEQTRDNNVITMQFCVNYGGRAEITDAVRAIAADAAAGRVNPEKITEASFRRYLDEPEIPDVDLFVRSSGEQRISNFLIWQSAYAELVFVDKYWPDWDRRDRGPSALCLSRPPVRRCGTERAGQVALAPFRGHCSSRATRQCPLPGRFASSIGRCAPIVHASTAFRGQYPFLGPEPARLGCPR